MTIKERAREIVLTIRNLSDEQAIEYVRAHLALAHGAGERSGIEQARQAINQVGEERAA